MDSRMILLIILAFIGLVMLIAGWKKAFKSAGGFKTAFMILGGVLVVYGLVGAGAQLGWYQLPEQAQMFFLSAGVSSVGGDNSDNGPIQCPSGTILQNGVCVSQSGGGATYQPTGTYSAKDKYSTTTIGGTSYYKKGADSATTTAQTNLNVGESVTYWISNTSYWVSPVTKNAGAGVTSFEALGLANGSASITLYDPVNRQTTTTGAYNTSLGANKLGYVDITYTGPAEASAGPFGGEMVIEYNSTISSVTCSNADVLMDSNPFHLTYTTSATTHTYKTWPYSSNLDSGSGAVKVINCQVKNGATAVGAGSPYYVKFYPANWYVTKAGDIVLDTEKNADSDTTKTGSLINLPSATGYWGA